VTINGVFYVALTAARICSLAERGRQQAATQWAARVRIGRARSWGAVRVRNARCSRISWRPDFAGVYVVEVKRDFRSKPFEKQLANFLAIKQK
jgi:hypothetical protein